MKTILLITGLLFLGATTLFAQKIYKVDTKNSLINWTGHAEIGTYAPAGTLHFSEGILVIKDNQLVSAGGKIDMKSMQQENPNLVNHLKSEDFFDVEKYPYSEIRIDKVVNGIAYGVLTIKNKSLPVQCPVTFTEKDGQYNVTGTLTIDRTKYNITYNSGSFFSNLGDKAIRNTFDVSFSIVFK